MDSIVNNKDFLGLIPARGGSKSIPRKNILKILNKPLIGWTIEVAKASKNINRVIVSTDDEEIAEIAKSFGAEVPFLRPKKYSEDFSRDIEYHQHTLKWLQANESYTPYALVNLRPTTPLRDPLVIDNAINEFLKSPISDSLRSVQLADQTPYKMWEIDVKRNLKQITFIDNIKEPYNEPRQKLPKVYWQNGYVDIVKSSVIRDKNSTTGNAILPFIIQNPSIDLDYPDEIEKAVNQLSNKLKEKISDPNFIEDESNRFPS